VNLDKGAPMKTNNISRREFIQKSSAGAAVTLAATSGLSCSLTKRSATDLVTLGESGVKVTRLGMGTGSNGGHVQRSIGQEEFTKVIRYGIERGISFIDTADSYNDLHEMINKAIKGLDREKLQIQCKISAKKYTEYATEIDRFRKELGTDYFDSFLLHNVRTADWVDEFARARDTLMELKEKQIIRAAGCSMHGLIPLRATANASWGDVRLVRVNHNGTHMDGSRGDWQEQGDVERALPQIEKMHQAGKGVIGMKLIGNGDFTDAQVRKDSIHFVMGLDYVDAVIIGFKSAQEIDEAIQNMNDGLNV
jgi:1-deoxyxylulose-5-phosphate synthase